MNNNIKSPYLNIWKYWLHSWDFWPAYPVMTRYFATSAMREIFMFCNIQMKMALQKKMIFETECHHWKLLFDSGWCVCLCVHVHACTYTFTHTHTHSWLYISLGITQFTLCLMSNIPEETMFQILISFCSQVWEWRGTCWAGCEWGSQSQSLYILHQMPPLIYVLTIITLGGIVSLTSHKQNLIKCAHRQAALWLGLPSDLISS